MADKDTKILITGACGFSARYLISLLLARKQLRLYCSDLRTKKGKSWYECDLTDPKAAFRLIKKITPDQIYQLAGAYSNDYETNYSSNVLITKNVLDAILHLGLKCRVLLIGSAAEYGNVTKADNPVREIHPLSAINVYGLTKIYQTFLMRLYRSVYNMDIVMARTFNLFGEGMSNKLFIGRLYDQIEDYKKGRCSKIKLGNLENSRDYIDVKEAVKCYEVIMNCGAPGEIYNVGSGRSIKIYDLLRSMLAENGLSMTAVAESSTVETATRADVRDIYADIGKLTLLKNTGLHNE